MKDFEIGLPQLEELLRADLRDYPYVLMREVSQDAV
jgi:hypothetical protein